MHSIAFDSISFGDVVRRYREAAGLSQRELATQVGISSSYMCRIEDGSRTPDLDKVVAIAAELGMDTTIELMDALVGDGGQNVLAPCAMDVARYLRDPEVSEDMKRAAVRTIEAVLRVR